MRILMKLLLVAASGLAVQSACAAEASASLAQVKGQVFVSHGASFAPAASGSALSSGDQVMARVGSNATIRYADGCEVNVAQGVVATVEFISPCAPGQIGQVVEGGAAGALGLGTGTVTAAIVGGVVVTTVVATEVVSQKQNDDANKEAAAALLAINRPTSP